MLAPRAPLRRPLSWSCAFASTSDREYGYAGKRRRAQRRHALTRKAPGAPTASWRAPWHEAPRGSLAGLLQFHRPVRRVQELLPAPVPLVGQADVDHRAALGLVRLAHEVHVRLLGRAAAFLDVALDAAADDVVPRAAAALRARDHVVQRELGRREPL